MRSATALEERGPVLDEEVEYVGQRIGGQGMPTEAFVYRLASGPGGATQKLLLPQRVVYHSPDGFEWGYAGSGPSDLALNLLVDAVGPERGLCSECGGKREQPVGHYCPRCGGRGVEKFIGECYQEFKFQVVAGLPRDGWVLTRAYIIDWLEGRGEA